MRKSDLGYVAGIIDGEGCISIAKIRKSNRTGGFEYNLRISVEHTNEWLIKWLQFNFEGSVHFRKRGSDKWKGTWAWQIAASKAAEFLLLILPYLKIKQSHAELALQFQKSKVIRCYRVCHKTDEELALEEARCALMHNFNKTGVHTQGFQ